MRGDLEQVGDGRFGLLRSVAKEIQCGCRIRIGQTCCELRRVGAVERTNPCFLLGILDERIDLPVSERQFSNGSEHHPVAIGRGLIRGGLDQAVFRLGLKAIARDQGYAGIVESVAGRNECISGKDSAALGVTLITCVVELQVAVYGLAQTLFDGQEGRCRLPLVGQMSGNGIVWREIRHGYVGERHRQRPVS